MELGEQLDHGQAEAGPLELSRQAAVDLTEWPEEARQSVRRDTDPAIGDTDLEKLLALAFGQGKGPALPRAGQLADGVARYPAGVQGDLAAVDRELHGVRQQVVDDL